MTIDVALRLHRSFLRESLLPPHSRLPPSPRMNSHLLPIFPLHNNHLYSLDLASRKHQASAVMATDPYWQLEKEYTTLTKITPSRSKPSSTLPSRAQWMARPRGRGSHRRCMSTASLAMN